MSKLLLSLGIIMGLTIGCVVDKQKAEDGQKEPEPKTYSVSVFNGGTRIDWWSYATFPEQVAPDRWEITDTYKEQKIVLVGSNLVLIITENR